MGEGEKIETILSKIISKSLLSLVFQKDPSDEKIKTNYFKKSSGITATNTCGESWNKHKHAHQLLKWEGSLRISLCKHHMCCIFNEDFGQANIVREERDHFKNFK